MNHQVLKAQPLLNKEGTLNEPGYATKPIFEYHRDMIKASKWRIKEWDYYACINDDFAVSFTVADLGYLSMLNVSFLDFTNGKETKKTIMKFFTFGKLNLPNDCDSGDTLHEDKNCSFRFHVEKTKRTLHVFMKNFRKGENFLADLVLKETKEDRMVIATPWKENKLAFYYNQKINCMPTSGQIRIGDKEYMYDDSKHFSVLDWGRGVWTYKNTWYWGSLSGLVDGKRIGFNIGYGFGDTTHATENMLFYEGKAHKLDEVRFELDDTDYMKPWKFTSSDNRLELEMTPLLDRVDNTNMVIIKNFGHQVFGRFNGYVILDDGSKIQINNIIGFAEKITNHY